MELASILGLIVVILFISNLYFIFHKKIIVEEKIVQEIDPEIESKAAGYKQTLKSIAYDAKTIKAARILAEEILQE